MKRHFCSIILVLFCFNSFGQSLFFDNLHSSNWTSTSIVTIQDLTTLKEIQLTKFNYSKALIKRKVSIWTFTDSILTVTNYDNTKNKDSLIGKYSFKADTLNSILQIQFSDVIKSNYKVGIISTGSFAILYRYTEKKANFTAKIDIQNATKDGIYVNDYVVHIPFDKLEKLNGKTVNIRGTVTIVNPNNLNKNGEMQQGRSVETKHILNPKIKVLD